MVAPVPDYTLDEYFALEDDLLTTVCRFAFQRGWGIQKWKDPISMSHSDALK